MEVIVLVVVSILMPTSQSEAAGEAGLGWWGALGEAAAAEILKSTGRSGSQPHNFGTCASNLSGDPWYSAIISKQGKLLQVDGLGLNLAIFIPMF